MAWTVVVDNFETENTTSFDSKDEAMPVYRKFVGLVEAGAIFSVTLRNPAGKRVYHMEEDAEE